MKVNPLKTQSLCIAASSSNHCSSHIFGPGGERIESGNRLKLLGFYFDNKPTPQAHVDHMVSKFRGRMWTLRYLKAAGLSTADLELAYVVFLRSIMEYAAPAIHPMLTKDQSKQLEVQQARALKIIHGFNKSYSQLLAITNL